MKRFATILLAAAAVSPPLAAPVLADDLPGVQKPKEIVQPLPEPADERTAGEKDAIRVGDWDVKVSGSIIVDIGVGDIKKPRR